MIGVGVVWLAAWLVVGEATGAAGDLEPVAIRSEFAGGVVVEASFPGRVVDWSFVTRVDGFDLLVLVEPRPPEGEDTAEGDAGPAVEVAAEPSPGPLPPCPGEAVQTASTLYRWPATGGASPLVVRDDLPHDARRVHGIDLDGDGVAETVVDTPRGRIRVGEDAGGDRFVLEGSGIHPLDAGAVYRVEPGRVRIFSPGPNGGYREAGEAPVRIDADVGHWGAVIRTPAVARVGRTAEGDALLAMPPEAVGNRRIRTGLIRVRGAAEASIEECWARLPGPEDVLESGVVLFDGAPLLVTTAKEAGRLGLLVEKRLRVHPLLSDRSRFGVEPRLAVESRVNLWQDATFSSTDVDGDGRADLAVGYWKGLKDSRVVIDVYLREEDGSFRDKAGTTAFDVDEGDRSWLRFGEDLDGDGRADLVVRSGEALHVYRGVASRNGAKVVAREPIVIPLDDGDSIGSTEFAVTVGGRPGEVRRWSRDDGPAIVDLAPFAGPPRAIVSCSRHHGRDRLQVARLDDRGN